MEVVDDIGEVSGASLVEGLDRRIVGICVCQVVQLCQCPYRILWASSGHQALHPIGSEFDGVALIGGSESGMCNPATDVVVVFHNEKVSH